MEGLKRAQRFRLEDQRGTEINFELPDFLKDNKLRKLKTNDDSDAKDVTELQQQKKSIGKTPQPAPRLSISRSSDNNSEYANGSPDKCSKQISSKDESIDNVNDQQSDGCTSQKYHTNTGSLPPPLPPKPKIKPTTWLNGTIHCEDKLNGNSSDSTIHSTNCVRNIKAPIADRINMLNSAVSAHEKKMPQPRTIYFDRLNSSFV